MGKKAAVLFLAILCALAGAAGAQAPEEADQAPDPNANLAKVGDEYITQGQYLRELGFRIRQASLRAGKPLQPDRKFRTETFESMVQARILSILARNAEVEVTEEAVQAEFENRRALIASEEAFQEYLTQEQLTKESLIDEIRRRMVVEAYIKQITADLSISDEEVKSEYARWSKRGLTKRPVVTYDIGLILIRPASMDDEGWSMAELIANDARHRIEEGESFEDVAKDVSSDLSAAERGGIFEETLGSEFLPEINSQITTLAPGSLSEPFKSEMGWHVIKVFARNEPGEMTYEKVAPRMKDYLLEQQKTQLLREKVKEANTYINVEVYRPDNLPEIESQ